MAEPVYHISAGNCDRRLRRCFFKDLLACTNPGQDPCERDVVRQFCAPWFFVRTALRPWRLCGFQPRSFTGLLRSALSRALPFTTIRSA